MSNEQGSTNTDPLEEFGFDIIYDNKHNKYLLKLKGENSAIEIENLGYKDWQHNYQEKLNAYLRNSIKKSSKNLSSYTSQNVPTPRQRQSSER